MNAYYKIYLESTIELVRSLIIKFDAMADAMNRPELEAGRELPLDPREWRYYKHLAGEYHFLDTAMTITSLDDSSIIVFNKENLEIHKKTKNVYLNNTAFTNVLAAKYPMQTNLINGIMHPIDISTAVNAEDGEILYYTPKYVETQEQRLIPETQLYIQSFLYRFMMESFALSDDLFVPTLMAQLYAFLPVKIMGIRYNYVKTAQTHSFHIRRYLASHNRLDEFIQYMTLPQILYLYRNILYIERHTGMALTYEDLIEHLMSVRNLPVYDYTLRQKAIDLANGSLSPHPTFVRTPLNLDTSLTSRNVDEWPIEEVIYKEVSQGTDNATYVDEYVKTTEALVSNNHISNVPTKIIQAAAIDPEDLEPIKLIDTLIAHWAYLAFKGKYVATADVINPINGETWKLNPKELFVLYIYATMYGFHNVAFTEFPKYEALGIAKLRWIPKSEYLDLVEYDAFDGWDDDIDFFQRTYYEIYNPLIDADDLMALSTEVLKRKRVRHQYVFQPHRLSERTGREAMYNYSYANIIVNLGLPGIADYNEFFRTLDFDYGLMSYEMWQDLSAVILNAATSFDAQNMISLKEIQSAMVRLFKRLSSYTIQFIEEIISDDSLILDPSVAIPDTTMESIEADVYIKEEPVVLFEALASEETDGDVLTPLFEISNINELIDRSYIIDPDVSFTADQQIVVSAHITIPLVSIASVVVL